MLERARKFELVKGVMVGRGEQHIEITHLFFAYDILCLPEERMMLDIQCALLCFQAVSGLNINLNKS